MVLDVVWLKDGPQKLTSLHYFLQVLLHTPDVGTQIEEFEMETVLRSYQYTLIIYSSTGRMTDVDLLHFASDLGDVLLQGVAGLESSKLLFDSLESIKMGCYLSLR